MVKILHSKYKNDYEDLHDYVLFMVNTGLRPDESKRIRFRDVAIVDDDCSKETVLEIDVRGKRGVGFCKSMPGAVRPFKRVLARRKPKPDELAFPKSRHELFNTILDETSLKLDREGQRTVCATATSTSVIRRTD